MVGILIITHGSLSCALAESCKLFCGEQEGIHALCLDPTDDVYEFRKCVGREIARLDNGDGVLVFVDLFGGSPSNCAAANLKNSCYECVTGVNLPMLIEALNYRSRCDLKELAEKSMIAGNESILNLRCIIQNHEPVS